MGWKNNETETVIHHVHLGKNTYLLRIHVLFSPWTHKHKSHCINNDTMIPDKKVNIKKTTNFLQRVSSRYLTVEFNIRLIIKTMDSCHASNGLCDSKVPVLVENRI